MTALTVPELDVAAGEAEAALAVGVALVAVVVVVTAPLEVRVTIVVAAPAVVRAALPALSTTAVAVLAPRAPSPYTAPQEIASTVRASAPTRRRMSRTRRARAASRRRSSADWGRGVFEVMRAVCAPPLTAPCASPESRLSQRESVRCSIFRPRAMITSLVSAGGKIPCPTTPGAASRRAASASGSANAVR